MHRYILTIIAAIFLCQAESSAQRGWFRQSPIPTGNDLLAVCFTDANTGTIVGDRGTILRTTDGGASWVSKSNGTSWDDFSGVSFIDANIGTAVSISGTILRTTDG